MPSLIYKDLRLTYPPNPLSRVNTHAISGNETESAPISDNCAGFYIVIIQPGGIIAKYIKEE